MKYSKLTQQKGFTIIELLIASSVFAVVLILVTFGILQISRTYYKGVTSAQTQQTARSIMDQISQSIQFSGSTPVETPATPPNAGVPAAFCLNGTRYSYMLGRQLSDTPVGAQSQASHVLVSDTLASCNGTAANLNSPTVFTDSPALVNPRELMGPHMRLATLKIKSLGSNLYSVIVRVVYGDNDLLDDKLDANGSAGTDNILDTCKNIQIGSQFCAVSELNTVVQKRLN